MNVYADRLKLSGAVVLSPQSAAGPEALAAAVLIEEIAARTGIALAHVRDWPEERTPVIVVASERLLPELAESMPEALAALVPPGPEGYRIAVGQGEPPIVYVAGADARGVLYGAGKLLRKLRLRQGAVELDASFGVSSTPDRSLRGHQLGYRPKTNAYDAWSKEQFAQYIRELALFGANSIEIMPPRTDDEATSAHMTVPAPEMMEHLSRTIAGYGLDVWIWYPNMAEDYSDPATIRAELAEREQLFRLLPRIDHVFIPGGDPGDIEPAPLFQWAEQVAGLLQRYHPQAKIWLSPQCFMPGREWVDAFYRCVGEQPSWLGGIVHGPWERHSLPELRARIPHRYPIRFYPDITHNYYCQFPVPNWDVAFAMTQGRESINPRPRAMKHIHNMFVRDTVGSLSYSEGIYDDVNKFIWSDQDWEPGTPVADTLLDYARLFICNELADEIAAAIAALEANWEGPLADNDQVERTLAQWQAIEAKAPEHAQNRYRFQLGLLRACYDAFLRRRLLRETELERQALEALAAAAAVGSSAAFAEAERLLAGTTLPPAAQALREKCETLAEQLFRSIGAQSDVARFGAQSWDRGAFMEHIDAPLNNARWILFQCEEARKQPDEPALLAAVDRLLNRTNPGTGGYYDHLGSPASWHRIKRTNEWAEDPEYYCSPLIGFATHLLRADPERQRAEYAAPLAWMSQAATHYDAPLTLRYEGLVPDADYRIKATYVGHMWGIWPGVFRLMANDRFLVHGDLDVNGRIVHGEWPLPREATSTGRLELTWSTAEGMLGPHVAEVWIIKS